MTVADTLSDSELRRRLTQRGIAGPVVERLVRRRDDHEVQDDLDRLLDNERK